MQKSAILCGSVNSNLSWEDSHKSLQKSVSYIFQIVVYEQSEKL